MFAADLKGNITLQHRTPLHTLFDQQGQRRNISHTLEDYRSPCTAPDLLNANVPVPQNPLVVNKGALRDTDVIPGPQCVGVHQVIQTGVKETLGAPGAVGDGHIVAVAVGLQRVTLLG